MSKILTNTVKKTAVWTAVLTYILAVAVALGIVFGMKGYGVFNKSATLDNSKTLTVSMNQYAYLTSLETVEDACEEVFGDLNVVYEMNGEMSGDESEIVYVFKEKVNLRKVEENLENKFAEMQKEGGALEGTSITVATNSEKTVEVLAKDYALRVVISAMVMVALVYIYAAIRFGIGKGVLAAIGTFYSIALTAAVVLLTRIPVTASVSYVFGAAGMFGAVISMLSLNKIKATEKIEGASELYAEEIVVSSLAKKEVAPIFVFSTAALLVMAIVAPVSMKWFALCAFIGVLAATVVGLIFVPSMYIPMKEAADKKPKDGYVGAKKTSMKEKKAFKKQTVVAPVAETPVEETPVEVPAEEAVEETAEEVPAEKTVEETVEEAPVEEVVEETAEEKTEENE